MGWRKRFSLQASETIKEEPRIPGAYGGFHQWRAKQASGSRHSFIFLYFKPSFHYGASRSGSGVFYVELSIDEARRSLRSLNEIISAIDNSLAKIK